MTVAENGPALENLATVQTNEDMVTATATGASDEMQQRSNTTMPVNSGHEPR
ncbi:hypothetical protein DVH05_021135 [Phytophthora capsici]|nr:hypothetical protein DVH05_003013 [Phytophthora capsici]KAG1694634.1 hypothetical protein DVH05_021135 [Phytophthora capsici]